MLTYGKTKNLLLITTLSLSEVFFWTELIMNRKINSFAQKYRVEELSSVVSLVESSEWLEVEKDELVSLTEADQLIIDEDVLVDSILRYTDRLIDEHLYNRNLPSPRPPLPPSNLDAPILGFRDVKRLLPCGL